MLPEAHLFHSVVYSFTHAGIGTPCFVAASGEWAVPFHPTKRTQTFARGPRQLQASVLALRECSQQADIRFFLVGMAFFSQGGDGCIIDAGRDRYFMMPESVFARAHGRRRGPSHGCSHWIARRCNRWCLGIAEEGQLRSLRGQKHGIVANTHPGVQYRDSSAMAHQPLSRLRRCAHQPHYTGTRPLLEVCMCRAR